MVKNLELLRAARAFRANLLQSRLYKHATINDAVQMAADLLRQLNHEERENCEV